MVYRLAPVSRSRSVWSVSTVILFSTAMISVDIGTANPATDRSQRTQRRLAFASLQKRDETHRDIGAFG